MARQRKIPKRSRTIPLRGNSIRGNGEDHNKWYRCWFCGFRCDTDRDSLGGPDSQAHIVPVEYTQLDEYGSTAYHCQVMAGKDETTCEAAGGTWASTRYQPETSGGCPLCGSPNYRGDY